MPSRLEVGSAAAARNEGLRAAQGSLVAFLDSDDLWHAGFVETLAALLERHSVCGAAFTGITTIDEDGHVTGVRDQGILGDTPEGELATPIDLLAIRFPFVTLATMARRTVLDDVRTIRRKPRALVGRRPVVPSCEEIRLRLHTDSAHLPPHALGKHHEWALARRRDLALLPAASRTFGTFLTSGTWRRGRSSLRRSSMPSSCFRSSCFARGDETRSWRLCLARTSVGCRCAFASAGR